MFDWIDQLFGRVPAKSGPEQFKYGTIYADPPWRYEVWDRDTGLGRSAESHYRTMTIEQLKGLDVSSLARRNCALLMWSTWTHIPQAIDLAGAWGFEYKTCALLWAKLNKKQGLEQHQASDDRLWAFGMGYWTRANTEPCLLFTRGNPKRISASVRQLLVSPIRLHSQKPDEAYDRIEKLLRGPYIELFSRKKRAGWEAIGYDIDGRDIRDVLKKQ